MFRLVQLLEAIVFLINSIIFQEPAPSIPKSERNVVQRTSADPAQNQSLNNPTTARNVNVNLEQIPAAPYVCALMFFVEYIVKFSQSESGNKSTPLGKNSHRCDSSNNGYRSYRWSSSLLWSSRSVSCIVFSLIVPRLELQKRLLTLQNTSHAFQIVEPYFFLKVE